MIVAAALGMFVLNACSIAQDAPRPPRGGEDARKHYIGHSTAACEVIDYGCPRGWTGFEDDKGCGCLEPAPAL